MTRSADKKLDIFQLDERHFQVLLQKSYDVIAIHNIKGKIVYVSPSVTNILGYSPEEFKKLNGFKYVYPGDIKKVLSLLKTIALKPGVTVKTELRLRHKKGEYRWVEAITTNQVKDPMIKGFITNFRDIDDRKKIEDSNRFLASIVASSDDAILGKDLNGIINSWNLAAERLYGYKAEEIVGKSVVTIFPEDRKEEFESIMRMVRIGEKIDHYDTVRRRKDGTNVEVSVTVSPIKDSTGEIIGASDIARNITQQKELDRRKDEFISITSHELRTPVTTIKSYNQLINIYLRNSSDEKLKLYAGRMESQIDRLVQLLNGLLDVSRIQAGKLELEKETFSLDELVRETVDESSRLSNHKITVRGKISGEILADKYRIGQVLTNLISNAIKYSPRRDKVIIHLDSNSKYIKVSVEDYGIGISKKNLDKIFERFYQADTKIRESFSGLGLGLYISNEIVRRHGGELTVQSEKGRGSTFTFTLPKDSAKIYQHG